MIDKQTIQRILDATDIVDVVKEFVTLKKQGVNYKGLCPFHNDRTPSFTVSPAKQVCKCFSCGKGGNAVHFLMEIEQMSYTEALKWLGRKYGIEIKERELTDEEKVAQSTRESMFVVNDWANKYFRKQLSDSVEGVAKGLAYFRSRGFRDEMIERFQLGFAPTERDAMAKAAISAGFNEEYLLKTGLCYKTDDGKVQDRYHGRVIFPVFTVSGKVVAFGGRILSSDKKLAKYVNSPESEIYSKSRELYGLYQAKNAIVQKGRCFMVEGYTDVISMHQSGIENVVASSGTSLTEGQIRLLHRFTENITVLYDGDAAGIKASMRGIDMLLADGLNIKVLLLPDGEDPDSFARKHRVEEFQQYIDSHQVDFIKFKTDLLKKDAEGDPVAKATLVTNVVKSISVIPDNIVRQMYITECAHMLSVTEELIVNELNKQRREKKYSGNRTKGSTPEEPVAAEAAEATSLMQMAASLESQEEKLLIGLVIKYGGMSMYVNPESAKPNYAPVGDSPTLSDESMPTMSVAAYIDKSLRLDNMQFQAELYQQILAEALECLKTQPTNWDSSQHFTHHTDARISRLAIDLATESTELSTTQRQQYVEEKYRLEEVIPRVIHDFKHAIVKKRLKLLLLQLRDPALIKNTSQAETLMRDYMELSAVERYLAQILGDRVVLK